jgi:hypothetical protein
VTRRTPPRWWRIGFGALTVVVVLVCLVTGWGGIVGSNPAYLITLNVVGLVAALAVASAFVTRLPATSPEPSTPATDADAAASPTAKPATTAPTDRTRPPIVALLSRGLQIAAVLLLVSGLLWLRPMAAEPVAIAAMDDGRGVVVTVSRTRIELRPTGTVHRTGLVFYPGALVDPRAYVAMLRPMTEAGYPVVIVKAAYDIAFFDPNAPSSVIAADPATTRWVIGGHSLGGVVAAQYAGDGKAGVAGLLLWASFPASSIAAAPLTVTSISGGNDGLSTPAKIDAAKPLLPPTTRYVVIPGAVHADFGDYGEQPNDGQRAIPHAEAQAQIQQASLDLLDRVDRA